MIAEILRLLQASSCFRGEICASLPCACAETLARLSARAQGARNPELVQSILTRVVDLPHFKNNQIEALVRDAKDALAELEAVCAPALTSTPDEPAQEALSKRPVAFRVIAGGAASFVFFDDEGVASRYAESLGLEYQGLYVRDGSALTSTHDQPIEKTEGGAS